MKIALAALLASLVVVPANAQSRPFVAQELREVEPERPIAAIIAAMIVLVIVMHIRTLMREHRARLSEGEIDHDLHDSQQR